MLLVSIFLWGIEVLYCLRQHKEFFGEIFHSQKFILKKEIYICLFFCFIKFIRRTHKRKKVYFSKHNIKHFPYVSIMLYSFSFKGSQVKLICYICSKIFSGAVTERLRTAQFLWSKNSEFDPSFGHQCWGDLSMLISIGILVCV